MNFSKLFIISLACILSLNFLFAATSYNGQLNINTASEDELSKLPYIGKAKATKIMEYRTSANFESIDDLKKVKGISEKLFNKIVPYVKVSGDSDFTAQKAQKKNKTN